MSLIFNIINIKIDKIFNLISLEESFRKKESPDKISHFQPQEFWEEENRFLKKELK
jgi:hypothetical protein